MKRNSISPEKQLLISHVSSFLGRRDDILFAYIHGSFARDEKFSDIDIGVFLREPASADSLDLELEFETAIQSLIGFPVDLRILNFAPLSFVYNVIRGSILIVDKDAGLRADFEGRIFKRYLDFAYFRRRYLKEAADAHL